MKRNSHTLIEMVVVTTVIGVLGAVTILSFNYIVPKRREMIARKIINELRWMKEHTRSQMKTDPPSDYCVAFFSRDATKGDFITFYDMTGVTFTLIRTTYLMNGTSNLVTAKDPASLVPPFHFFFARVLEERHAVPVSPAGFGGASFPLDIEIDGTAKIHITSNTGDIEYIK